MYNILIHKKFSIYEILQVVFPISLTTFIFYITHLQNKQINELNTKIDKINNYSKDIMAKMIIKDAENQKLQKTIKELTSLYQNKIQSDPALILSQNELTKMYIHYFGTFILTGLCFYIVYNILSGFTLKKLIPLSLYNFLQNHTYFFQNHKTYNYTDNINFKIIIDILNDKHVNFINICDIENKLPEDYISLSKYILDLKSTPESTVTLYNQVQALTPKIIDSAEVCSRIFDAF